MVPEFRELSLVRVVKSKSRTQSKRSKLENRQNSAASNEMLRKEIPSGMPAKETMGK